MANKKPKIQVAVPSTGVRRDVNPMLHTPEMASIGDNCMYLDGTIRPRPCMTKEINDPTTGLPVFPQLGELYDGTGATITPTAISDTDDGYLIIATDTHVLLHSIDNAMNWISGSLTYPSAGKDVYYMQQRGIYLYAFVETAIGFELYRSPVSGLPSALAWTQVSSYGGISITDAARFDYDETNDAWLVHMNSGTGYIRIFAVYDASTDAAGTISLLGSRNLKGNVEVGSAWVNEAFIVTTSYYSGATVGSSYLESWSIVFSGSTYTLASTSAHEWEFMGEIGNNPLGYAYPAYPYARLSKVVNASQNNGFSFWVTSSIEDDFICWVELSSAGQFETSTLTQRRVSNAVDNPGDADYDSRKMVFACEKLSGSILTIQYWVSIDGGNTWMEMEGTVDKPGTSSFANVKLFMSHETGRNLSTISWLTGAYVADGGQAFAAPSTDLAPKIGDVTTAFQADLNDEDRVIVIGATHGIARLNRSTNEWDRITANDDETIDHNPTGVWVDEDTTFDIPPLSAYPDDTSYVSGVSINGVYGSNPWVFRTFEARGETFLLGTNGQCYPICYHPDMPGGFARRLGEMTEDDPNYDALALSPLGDLAPKAKCIATAANRVLSANDPAGSKFQVSVSAFNDPDRGWGDAQEVLLGDTTGGIVSMNEISALQVAIYKEDAIYHAIAQTEFLGVSAPFRFELSKAGISGPCSPAAVLRNYDGRQIYLSRDGGVYMYDGVAPIDLGANVRKMIQGNINLDHLGKCWGVVDVKRKLIWFFYPSSSNLVNRGIVVSTDQGFPYPVWPVIFPYGWDFVTGIDAILTSDITLGELDVLDSYDDDVTLDSFSSGETAMLMGLKTGIFFSHEYGEREEQYTDDGVPIPVHLQCGWITPGSAEVYTADTLHHIFSCADVEQELEVRLRAQQLGRNIRVSKVSLLSSGKLQRRTRHRVSGTQFSVDIQGSIKRLFNWGGGALSLVKRGGR